MMSSKPTAYPGVHGNIPNPYPQTIFMAPQSQQPPSFITLGNQPLGVQPHFIPAPGISVGQLGQGNAQMINSTIDTAREKLKEDAKILGVVQIIIGCIHFGFGIILCLIFDLSGYVQGFASLAVLGGYPFWGAIFFIVSGSLSVSASSNSSTCLIKGSLGMNIVSAIFTLPGVILLLLDMILNNQFTINYWALVSGSGISAMLLIFSLLEFCIACATAHFASKILANTSRPVVVIPAMYANNSFTPDSSSPPPAYASLPTDTPRQ
ncbi:membrane-spanning 4-domains subfamily A member 12-like [Tupaia chinensis]|uniref:membrane-spanning 4-domains subfamily A member 12-like n=1 Tax=Tupaia chinensis TaxID=246437 RepID=UPI000FFC7968|nr:membrane-spanning 4-domains subfamily A member 12-like [Tupaia chinensis]